MIKNFLFGFVALYLMATAFNASANDLALIPWPQQVQPQAGSFTLTSQTRICADWSSRQTAQFLAQRLRQSTGYPLKVHWRLFGALPQNGILLTTKNANTNLGPEGYELLVTTNGIVIRASTQAGLFYGGQTLLQLLPPEIFSTNVVTENWQAPCVQIEDWPRFPWRGLMLDVSRHFYKPSEVEAILDEMAVYKLNRFHWHLVDDDGWRIEIKKYPKLTQIGAWRQKVGLERNHRTDGETNTWPAWIKPTADKFAPDGRYGGYYTPDEIREMVAYATTRHIMVVPEIEMPGHSGAALAAYPELGCTGRPYEIERPGIFHGGALDPAKPKVYTFLDDVLTETFKLFPAPYVHIGGDEVAKGVWNQYPDCQALMKQQGIAVTNEAALQTWFTERMVSFISAHGKTPIGWSEVMRGGLATNVVIMDWIGGGEKAAAAGHDAIMSPADPVDFAYFDHYQSTNHAVEPRAIGGYLPLRRVYAFEPMPTNLPASLQSHILGPQGNLWTEYVASLPHAQYMIFPRACAMAEVGWSAKDARNWDDFTQRLTVDEKRLDELGVNYRPGMSDPDVRPPPPKKSAHHHWHHKQDSD